MRRLLAWLLILLVLTGCASGSKRQSEPAPPLAPVVQPSSPPVGDSAPPPVAEVWSARPGMSEEAFVRELLGALAAGSRVLWLPEGGLGRGMSESGLPAFQANHLRRAAGAWEAAGSPELDLSPHVGSISLHQYVQRFPFLDTASAQILHLDRTGAPDRFGALVHVKPHAAFFYLAFRRDGEKLVPVRLVDTKLHAFRRAPAEDLRLLDLIAASRWEELAGHLLVPYECLVAAEPHGERVLPFSQLVSPDRLKVGAHEGRLMLGEQAFSFDWVRLPDGSYKVVGATLYPAEYRPDKPQPLPVAALPSAPGLTEEAVRSTAAAFVRLWGEGRIAEAEAMAPDLARFHALSALADSGRFDWVNHQSYWSLAAEKARLDFGFDAAAPVDWAGARVTEVSMAEPVRARVTFPGGPVTVDVYVTAPGQVGAIALGYPWENGRSQGREEYLLDRLPRLGDWERGARFLEALAAGSWAGAARAAGLSEAELTALLEREAQWAAGGERPAGPQGWLAEAQRLAGSAQTVEPGSWPVSWQVMHGLGVDLIQGDLRGHLAFTGPDGDRRLALAALGSVESSPTLPVGIYAHTRSGGLREEWRRPADLGYLHVSPAGQKLLFFQMPFDGSVHGPLRFYRPEGGQLAPVLDLSAPEGMQWQPWQLWQSPGQPQWWAPYAAPDSPLPAGVAQIRWDDAGPRIVAQIPSPDMEQNGTGRFVDVDGDGVLEFAGLRGMPNSGEERPVSVQWQVDGGWQERQYPAGSYWPSPLADRLGSRIVFPLPGRLVTIRFRAGVGPGEVVEYPFPFQQEHQPGNDSQFRSTDGLIWWQGGEQFHWLGAKGIVSVPGGQVVAAADLLGRGRTMVLVSERSPSALRLYELDGTLIWQAAWPYYLEPGVSAPLTDEGRIDVAAHGRHPDEPRISRIMALRVSDRGPQLLWQGPLLSRARGVDLAVADVDGSPLRDIFLLRWGSKGYQGLDLYSDSVTPWGKPLIGAEAP
ncbi:MAG: hypothetical protein ACOY94_18335 [Bacillota bacterium]